jgi:hypothetical protein
MPLWRDGRPLKRWTYVGVYGPRVMLCIGTFALGPMRQGWWSVWDRQTRRKHERTAFGRGGVTIEPGVAQVSGRGVHIDLRLEQNEGVENVNPHGGSFAWTRKQGGVHNQGTVAVGGQRIAVDDFGLVDESAGYHARHTRWRWVAGVGRSEDEHALAWNLVEGINDGPTGSERTLWVDGEPTELAPVRIAEDLSQTVLADGSILRFDAEAERAADQNRLFIRSRYRQPFGTFSGTFPGGLILREGYGVMEEHDVLW